MTLFCRHLQNGLVYNNNTTSFTVSPCCFFQNFNNEIDPSKNLDRQLQLYRTKWMTADVSKHCKICIDAENQKLSSYRQSSFDIIEGIESNLEFLTVAVNKKCNLACPSCDSSCSSFWYQENTRHGVVEIPKIRNMHDEDRQGEITNRFIDLLADQDLSKLKYIKFGGGEPLMSDTHERILSLISYPEQVTIQYTSNFSIMPSQSVIELWHKFKLVKWVASLDGIGEKFSFLRWPYRWEKLENFVRQAVDQVPDNVMFGVEHTINPLNVYFFNEFSNWFDQSFSANRYGDKSDFNIHICNGVLGLENTPPKLRTKILEKYGTDHAVSIALQQTPYSGNTKQLVAYLDQLETWRGTRWRKIFGEVQDFFYA